MGWFWADSSISWRDNGPRRSSSGASPPPGCPMHSANHAEAAHDGTVKTHDESQQTPSSCPVKHTSTKSPSIPTIATAEVDNDATSSRLGRYNPLNYMFASLSNKPSANQSMRLGLERETSSIPRGDVDSNWEYPSPQQMYNAMLRKGYTDTPIDAVTSMVEVHNFLNEGAWREIMAWERIFGQGLRAGWERCSMGEENMAMIQARRATRGEADRDVQPKLLKFEGRPKEMTPKAVMLQVMGWLYPSKFEIEPPFDRHDWYVQRSTPTGPRQIRYVIDYYSGEPEVTGEPVFYLDIRPAVDSPTAAAERLIRWSGDMWYRASGAAARETAVQRKQGTILR